MLSESARARINIKQIHHWPVKVQTFSYICRVAAAAARWWSPQLLSILIQFFSIIIKIVVSAL